MIWSFLRSLHSGTRWRLALVTAVALAVLMGLFQNCGRWQGVIESPRNIYNQEALLQLGELNQNQKNTICQSAANYQCRRLRLAVNLLDRHLAEMVCMDHEAFPRRVCIQTEYIDRSEVDPEIPCEVCGGIEAVSKGGEWEEYSCFNAALKIRTLVEHRLFAETLDQALSRTYLACRASLNFDPTDF